LTPNFNYNRVSLIDHEKRNALTLKEETLKNKKLNLWKKKNEHPATTNSSSTTSTTAMGVRGQHIKFTRRPSSSL